MKVICFIILSISLSISQSRDIKIIQFSKRKLLFSNNFESNTKEDDLNICDVECDKLSKIYGCFCDAECDRYNDCCKIYINKCENYFSELKKGLKFNHSSSQKKIVSNNGKNNANSQSGSCCSDLEPFGCFCDSRCLLFGDCCDDYKKCDTAIQSLSLSQRINKSKNKMENKEENIIKVKILSRRPNKKINLKNKIYNSEKISMKAVNNTINITFFSLNITK